MTVSGVNTHIQIKYIAYFISMIENAGNNIKRGLSILTSARCEIKFIFINGNGTKGRKMTIFRIYEIAKHWMRKHIVKHVGWQ
jgi:hypothetical protein